MHIHSTKQSGQVMSILIVCVTILVLAGGFLWYQKQNTTEVSESNDGQYIMQASVTDTVKCAPATGTVLISGTSVSGTLTTTRNIVAAISAQVDAKGNITTGATTNGVVFTGSVKNGIGQGVWSDVYGCTGQFTMTKSTGTVQTQVDIPENNINVRIDAGSVQVKTPVVPTPTPTQNTTQTNVTTKTVTAKPTVSTQTTNTTNTVTVTGNAGGVSATVTYVGNWSGRASDTSGGLCQGYTLTGTVSGGIMSGVARGEILGDVSGFKAGISQTGAITGIAGELVQFNGQITADGRSASGNYYFVPASGSACRGSFMFTKN